MLDAQEYLHLAITSSRNGRQQEALEQLHSCLEIDPNDVTAIFFLAAEHAELGMYDRAIEGMKDALGKDPNLEIARLQLGMLYATIGEGEKAMESWRQLESSATDQALSLFAQGFSALYNGEREEAEKILSAAATANSTNLALNAAAEQILLQAKSQPLEEKSTPTDNKPKDSRYLGAYSSSAIGDRK